MSFGLRSGQLGCLDVTSPHRWPMSPRPPATRRLHTLPPMQSPSRGQRPLSIPDRPAWDYSSTKMNRTTAIDYSRVKAPESGPSLFDRHEVHQTFFYETRPAIHEMSDGLTDRLKAAQSRAEAVVFSSRLLPRPPASQHRREEQARAVGQARIEAQSDQEDAVNKLFWSITAGKLPDDVDEMWRRPSVGSFAWSA